MWNDIEIAKVEFFVEGAREIYRILGDLGVPGHDPCAALPELTGPALMEIFSGFNGGGEPDMKFYMSSDPLASTRNNTSAVISGSPVGCTGRTSRPIRAGSPSKPIYSRRLTAFPRIARTFKARIITDIVSFCDCLVIPPVSATAPQAIAGLDKLIAANGELALAWLSNYFSSRDPVLGTIRDKSAFHYDKRLGP